MRALQSLSDAEKSLFRSEVATQIYIQLNRYPHTLTDLEKETGCSSGSIRDNLAKGTRVGVWKKDYPYYKLTDQGKELPEAVGTLGKIQQDYKINIDGKTYYHANQTSKYSTVYEERIDESGSLVTLKSSNNNQPDDDSDDDHSSGGSASWIGSAFG